MKKHEFDYVPLLLLILLELILIVGTIWVMISFFGR